MDFSNRGNRPMQQQQQAAPQSTTVNEPQSPMLNLPEKTSKKNKMNFGKMSSVFVLFGVSLLVAVLIVALVFGGKKNVNTEAEQIKTDKYQAVFLNSQDGQVYFGKLRIYNSDLYVLTDIYYVRVEQKVQPEGTNQQSQQNISLAKLGNELHGPEDVMYISRDKVLFWENLKDDGQVAKAISEYKAKGDSSSTSGNDSSTDTTDTNTNDTTTNP